MKEFRRKRRLDAEGNPIVTAPLKESRHRDRLSHEVRRDGEQVPSLPKAIPSRSGWASSPKFIRRGSAIFDEVFRIGMGFPTGLALSFAVLDFREFTEERTQAGSAALAALEGIVGVFGFGLFLAVPVCIVWGFFRQAQAKAARKKRVPLPEPIRWLGLPAMLIGFVCYLFVRTL